MKKLMILAGMLAALLVAAAPALGQQGVPPGVPPNQPEEVTVTGVVQPIEREPAFIEGPRFRITDQQTGVDRPLIGDIVEGGVDLSQFVGERVTVTGIPDTQGQPISGFENPDELPLFVTSVEPAGEGAQQDQYQAQKQAGSGQQQQQAGGGQPARESGGQQPQAAPEQQTTGEQDVLPDTGGPAPLLAIGGLLLLGSGIAGLYVARRRAL